MNPAKDDPIRLSRTYKNGPHEERIRDLESEVALMREQLDRALALLEGRNILTRPAPGTPLPGELPHACAE